MKKLIILLISAFFAITSCDKVPPRVPPAPPDCILNASTTIVNSNTLTSNTRKVLLEDYTGHYCGQCPPAGKKAEVIGATYDRVVVIANHVTETFASPRKNYVEDFRNEASTLWDAAFDMSKAGLPKGSVNRMLVSGSYPQNFTAWEANVISELAKPQTVQLDITTQYDPTQGLLNVKVLTTFKTAMSTNVNINMVLTQDSIVSNQRDYAPPAGALVVDSDRRPDYKFDHIMVKALNGAWGELIKKAPIAKNDTASITKSCNTITKCFYQDKVCTDDKHMYLVVFAYDEATKEILQVEKVKLTKSGSSL